MKPLFFPFTYVTEPAINACVSFFSEVAVFQFSTKHIPEPMRQWAAKGLLDIRTPDPETFKVFDAILSDSENWVRQQRGGIASFLKGSRNRIPFFESSSVSQIRQDIRNAGQAVSPEMPQEAALLRARIFLQMAQEFDRHNEWLSHQMRRQETMERNFYQELRGDEHLAGRIIDSGPAWDNDDPFQYMILDRMKSWSRVMLSQGREKGPFVTDRASVLTMMEEYLQDNEKFIPAAAVPAIDRDAATAKKERQELISCCENLVHTPVTRLNGSKLLDNYSTETTAPLYMKLYLLPGVDPRSFFSRFVDDKRRVGGTGMDTAAEMNTLIGCIEKNQYEDNSGNCQKKT